MRIQQSFHRLDVLFVLKPGKHLQIIQCFGEVPSRNQPISITSVPDYRMEGGG